MKNQCSTNGSAAPSCGTSKCCSKLFKGMLIGGLVMFAYLAASWMVLPWHKGTLNSFKNNNAVASVLAANADKSGVYMLSQETVKKGKVTTEVASKPFAFVSVLSGGVDPARIRASLTSNLLLCLFSALLLTALLKKGSCCGGCPVGFSMTVGLLVACASHLPGLIWYHFPLNFTLLGMADDVIAFTLAGAAIGKCVLGMGKGSCSTGQPSSGGSCSMGGK